MVEKFLIPFTKWSYANLTKSAKLFGGPEKFIRTIYATGYLQGYIKARLEMTSTNGVTILPK